MSVRQGDEKLGEADDEGVSQVLVVDDKEMMRDSVGAMLASRGHAVVASASAPEALEKIE